MQPRQMMKSPKKILVVLACLVFGAAYMALAEERSLAGEKPNIPTGTFGGMQLWEDLRVLAGWRIQRNVVTGHHRLLDDGDVRRAWGSWEDCETALNSARSVHNLKPASDHAVVLLHGLGRTKTMYRSLAAKLEAEGYEVVTVNYPSTRRSIEAHADQVEQVLGHLEGITTVSFVTHSLGGIVMREVLSRDSDWRQTVEPHRLVMMGPPNQGSVFAREVPKGAADRIIGASLDELRDISAKDIPAPVIEFGIIAGGRGQEGYNPLIPGNDDGVVAVTETHLAGASDFLVVEGLHSYLPSNERAAEATIHFLANGRFPPKEG